LWLLGFKSTENIVFKAMMAIYERWAPKGNWSMEQRPLHFDFGNQDSIDPRLFDAAIRLHTPPDMRDI
jgi:hypothetical protein